MATQVKSIPLTGLSTNPSDLMSDDGNLASAVNVVHELGSIKAVGETSPKLLSNLGANSAIFRHENATYKNIIVKTSDGKYKWSSESELINPTSTAQTETDTYEISVSSSFRFYKANGDYITSCSNGAKLNFDPSTIEGGKVVVVPSISVYSAKNSGTSEIVSFGTDFIEKYNRITYNGVSLGENATITTTKEYSGSYYLEYAFTAFGNEIIYKAGFLIEKGLVSVTIGGTPASVAESSSTRTTIDDEQDELFPDASDSVDIEQDGSITIKPEITDSVDNSSSTTEVKFNFAVQSKTQTSCVIAYESDNDIYVSTTGNVSSYTKVCDAGIGTLSLGVGTRFYAYFVGGNPQNVVQINVYAPTTKSYVAPTGATTLPATIEVERTINKYFTELEGISSVKVVAVKNIIIFYSSSNTYYYLFNNESYRFLGNSVPKIEMSFALEGHTYLNHAENVVEGGKYDMFDLGLVLNPKSPITDSTHFKSLDNLTFPSFNFLNISTNAERQKEAVDVSLSEANTFVKNTSNDGYFTQPFLARFAVRLFDGTHTNVSAPILMTPSLSSNPMIVIPAAKATSTIGLGFMTAFGIAAKLKYYLKGVDLNSWDDIVEGVDIFVSSPFYTYKQDRAKYTETHIRIGAIEEKIYYGRDNYSNSIVDTGAGSKFLDSTYKVAEEILKNRCSDNQMVQSGNLKSSIIECATETEPSTTYEKVIYYDTNTGAPVIIFTGSHGGVTSTFFNLNILDKELYYILESRDKSEILDDVSKCSNFYLLQSIKTKDLSYSEDGAIVDFKPGILNNIETQEMLVEGFEDLHTIIPKTVVSYNGRVSYANFEKKPFGGFKFDNMAQIQNVGNITSKIVSAVTIKCGANKAVKCTISDREYAIPFCNLMVYYPDTNVESLDLYFGYSHAGTYKVYTLHCEMENHDMLNGCYWLGTTGLSKQFKETNYTSLNNVVSSISKDYSINVANEVRTSEVNNPFIVMASNVEVVGNGKIIALTPQSDALSEGQFGQYPMIAFTTDGIWALEVNKTGGWSSKQPFSRDVVLNEDNDNILQLDRQIAFSTNRGLMLLSGRKVECISEIFDGNKDDFLVVTSDGKKDAYKFFAEKLLNVSTISDIGNVRPDFTTGNGAQLHLDFKEYIANATFLYDYTHQRIIVGNENYSFAYVFNMRDHLWTTINQRVLSSVNSYPNCYAMTKDSDGNNLLVDFAASNGVASQVDLPGNGFIITRPIKLGDSTALKTIRTINAQGQFDKSHVSMVLLGCNDNAMKNWVVLSTCKGSRLAFKYGTPFKYFRVALLTSLTKGETLSSITLEYEVKDTNKLRQ